MRTTCLGLMIVCLFAGSFAEGAELPKAKIQLKIVDQDGDSVENARIFGGFTTGTRVNDYAMLEGVTDVGGSYVASGPCNEFLRYEITKEGYYATQEKVSFADKKNHYQIVDGKWQPYGETRTVVLKKIVHPIPLGKVGRCSIAIPEFDKWIGFDFEKRQWVPPYGSGESADVMLRFGRDIQDRQTNYKVSMDVSFAHLPHAGCYELKSEAFSERNTVYHADTNACFQTTLSYSQVRRPESRRVENWLDKDAYLVFRTRTATDEKGRLKSAHYGIIRGPWSSFNTMLSAGYLFNAVPNDINLEDDHTARLSLLHYQQSLEFEKSRKGK